MTSHKRPLSKKQIGILWLTIPFFCFILFCLWFAFGSMLLSSVLEGGAEGSVKTGLVGFGMIGGIGFILSFVLMLFGVGMGFYFFSRVESHEVSDLARRSAYEGLSHEHVEYIAKWSWSAFFLKWIWTLSNRGMRFWTLGMFAPILNYYFVVKIAMHGRRMSWESGQWKSFKQFRKRQQILAWVAWIVPVLGVGFSLWLFSVIPHRLTQSLTGISGGTVLDSTSMDADSLCKDLTDTDGDGLLDLYETRYFVTNPIKTDTDSDGFSDKEELENGYDPTKEGGITQPQKMWFTNHTARLEHCEKVL